MVTKKTKKNVAAKAVMKATTKRIAKPIRSRKMRADAKAEAAIAELAKQVGVPSEAISISYPGGRNFRSDSTIANLRKAWKDKDD